MPIADWKEQLRDNLARVRENIANACQRAGREPAAVRLVAVTKYVSPTVLREVVAAGIPDIGESRVQQLVARARELGPSRLDWPDQPEAGPVQGPRWHMIGHLQRNKVKLLLPHARIVHSLDSVRLAEALDQQAEQLGAVVDAFIEVNLAGEVSKTGIQPEGAQALVEAVNTCRRIRLRGLMTMAPLGPDAEAARPDFARLRELLERLRADRAVPPTCSHLSMGMSQDYTVAVEEGATFVRIGSALFEGLLGSGPLAG
jgi:hypothetical protein